MDQPPATLTVFAGDRRLVSGAIGEAALAAKSALDAGEPVLAFDAAGRVVDLDLRGEVAEVLARHAPPQAASEARGRGRPRLGVIAREVTLLPRHWDWLAAQPGGASAALRRMVETARLRDGEAGRIRLAREAAYRFMTTMAGDRPGYEEAIRALFAGDRTRLEDLVAGWPGDLRDHAIGLAFPEPGQEVSP